MMSNSPAVQAARKKMQEARLAQKSSNPENYPAFYASQPAQVERARLWDAYSNSVDTLNKAREDLEVALITGENLDAAKEAYAIASLVAERTKPPAHSAQLASNLTGA